MYGALITIGTAIFADGKIWNFISIAYMTKQIYHYLKGSCPCFKFHVIFLSDWNLWSSHLLSKNLKIKIYKTINLPAVLYGVLVGKPEGKRPLGKHRRRLEDNIKMDHRGMG
jgi:hypothetical protein